VNVDSAAIDDLARQVASMPTPNALVIQRKHFRLLVRRMIMGPQSQWVGHLVTVEALEYRRKKLKRRARMARKKKRGWA
jgi:hypothetical protein